MQLTHGNKNPKSVLPSDIFNYVSSSPDWVDITQHYKCFYFDNPKSGSLILGAEVEQKLVDHTQLMGFNQQLFVNRINSIRTKQGHSADLLTAPMSFWTNNIARCVTIPSFLCYWGRMLRSLMRYPFEKLKNKSLPKDEIPLEKNRTKKEGSWRWLIHLNTSHAVEAANVSTLLTADLQLSKFVRPAPGA